MRVERDSAGAAHRRWLLFLFLLALLVRVAAVTFVGSFLIERTTYEHGEIARNLVLGRGFRVAWFGVEGPTSTQAPIYPHLLAFWYWLLGIDSPLALLAMQLMQSLLGALTAPLTVLLAAELLGSQWVATGASHTCVCAELRSPSSSKRLLRHDAGSGPDAARARAAGRLPLAALPWLAGFGVALYPTLIYAVTQIQVAWLAALLTVLTLWLAAGAARRRSPALAALSGLSGGLLVLTDPILSLVVFAAVALLAFWSPAWLAASHDPVQTAGRCRRGIALAGVGFATCVIAVAPWLARNWLVHGRFVPVKSTFGYAFWQGNHPRSWGTDKIPLTMRAAKGKGAAVGWLHSLEQALWQQRLIDTMYIDDAVLSAERRAELAKLSEPDRSRRLLLEAIGYVRENPARYVQLCLRRLSYFLWYDPTNPKSRLLLFRLVHGGLTLLSLAGLWLSRRLWRQLWPTYLAFALVTLFHTLTIVSVRFHIPLEPIAIVWAAFVPAWAYAAIASRSAAARSAGVPFMVPPTHTHTRSGQSRSRAGLPRRFGSPGGRSRR